MIDYLIVLSVALAGAAVGCLAASYVCSRRAARLREMRKAAAAERMRKVLGELALSMGVAPPPPAPPLPREVRGL